MKFTIGYRSRFPEQYSKYLGPSLDNLKGDYDLIKIESNKITDARDFQSEKYPASDYNEMIRMCKTQYLILVHEDISFTPDFLESVENTINQYPDFGAIGLVGHDDTDYRWSNSDKSYEVHTLDSCMIIVRMDLNMFFDDDTFNELHLYVEDYCARVGLLGKKVLTINTIGDCHIEHHSSTWSQLGVCWGNYPHYKQIFVKKYPNILTT